MVLSTADKLAVAQSESRTADKGSKGEREEGQRSECSTKSQNESRKGGVQLYSFAFTLPLSKISLMPVCVLGNRQVQQAADSHRMATRLAFL